MRFAIAHCCQSDQSDRKILLSKIARNYCFCSIDLLVERRLMRRTENFLKVPRSGTFKKFSVLLKASIGCNVSCMDRSMRHYPSIHLPIYPSTDPHSYISNINGNFPPHLPLFEVANCHWHIAQIVSAIDKRDNFSSFNQIP